MKIFFHLNSMGRGGAERVISVLSQKFLDDGHQVILATLWESENEYPLDMRVKRISVGLTDEDEELGRLPKIILRYTRLREAIIKEQPDLVISFCNKANFRCSVSMLGINIPLIVSVRNNPEVDYAPYRISTWIMEHKATGCVFQTPDAQAFFSKKLQRKSRVIFNPLSDTFINKVKYLEVTERSKEIVNVGRISAQKNQFMLIKAFQKIADKYPDYILKIYGDVQDDRLFWELKHYLGLSRFTERVRFMGASNRLQEEICNASLFALSSDYEGMPNALIEAMVLGIPSVSTDCPCGGSRLLIEDGVSGRLTLVGDEETMAQAMDDILSDKEKAEKMGLEGKKIIDKVHPDKIVKEWEEFITQLI